MDLVIAVDDPRAEDVRTLLGTHLAFSQEVSPPGHVHALDVGGLLDPAVTFFSARRDGVLLAVGALKRLDESHAELKSMHTSEAVRGQGVGRAMVDHLLVVAADRRYQRVSLETGTADAFLPARALYAKVGFKPCEPYGGYTVNPHSTCMTINIEGRADPMAKQFDTIDDYIQSLPTDVQQIVESIRQTVRTAAPDSVETIAYQMPTFKWKGKSLIHFGAWKDHIGIYPIPAGSATFEKKLSKYTSGKGTVRFPIREPIPHDIVRAMVTLRMKEISAPRG
jgi:putative acetyltransferase